MYIRTTIPLNNREKTVDAIEKGGKLCMREKYESLALADLKAIAKSRGIKGTSTMKKAEVVDAMLKMDERESRGEDGAGEESGGGARRRTEDTPDTGAAARAERPEQGERSERTERAEKTERSERPERAERNERPERGER